MNYKKNSDGTDMLDNEGNPIPEENANDETITPEEAARLKKAVDDTVEELKILRKKNKELTEKLEPEIENLVVEDEATKLANAVKRVLDSEKMENAKIEKSKAFDRFIMEHKEFHPDNDPTGLKRQALETKLARFNTESITDVAEYYDMIGEAQLLLTGVDSLSKDSKEIQNPYSSSPQSRLAPKIVVSDKLTPQERKLVERGSATEEYILKLKQTKPAFLRQILAQVTE